MTRTQVGILLSGALPVLLLVVAFGASERLLTALPAGWVGDPMRLAAGCYAAIGFTLLWAILKVALNRYVSPADIAGAAFTEPTQGVKIRRAILQNTLEQVVLAAIAYFAYAAVAPAERLALLPALAGLFILGRIAFRFGYPHGAVWRAPGVALTFLPSILTYLLILGFWLSPS